MWKRNHAAKTGGKPEVFHVPPEAPKRRASCQEEKWKRKILTTRRDTAEDFDILWVIQINHLEYFRKKYNETKDKRYWKELIRLLPESWLQKRTVIMNYENVLNMYHQRKNHKLNEWSGKDDPTKQNFCSWALEMPYAQEFVIEPFENKKQGD